MSDDGLEQEFMKHIAFRIIVLCVLLPPLCYGFTVRGIEHYLGHKYTHDIEQGCVGDTSLLFQGSVRLKNAVDSNVDRYLKRQKLLSWGVRATVWVTTGKGVLLYPAPVETVTALPHPNEAPEIASENYSLLHDGLSVTVDVELLFGRLLPNIILGTYLLLAVVILFGTYRDGIRKTQQEEAFLNEKIQRLQGQEQAFSRRLAELKADWERASEERDRLEKTLEAEKRKAGSNESELFNEIVQLDEKLTRNLQQQTQQEEEIKILSEKIRDYEVELKKTSAQKGKQADVIARRFGALYKNTVIHERALEGFTALTEDMRIKCEEVIHRLNEAPDQVPVKRKVFSGKGRETVLEVLFSYNGRLYFRRTREQQVEVLAVGSKNTQQRDLEFIDKISRKI